MELSRAGLLNCRTFISVALQLAINRGLNQILPGTPHLLEDRGLIESPVIYPISESADVAPTIATAYRERDVVLTSLVNFSRETNDKKSQPVMELMKVCRY